MNTQPCTRIERISVNLEILYKYMHAIYKYAYMHNHLSPLVLKSWRGLYEKQQTVYLITSGREESLKNIKIIHHQLKQDKTENHLIENLC